MMRITAVVVVLCVVVGAVQAGITMNAVNVGPTQDLPGYSTWIVHLVSPEKVSALEAEFIGPMNQVFAFGGAAETPYPNSPGYSALTAVQKAQDSHILLTTTQLAIVWSFHEDQGDGVPTCRLAGWQTDADGNFIAWGRAAVGIWAPHQQIDLPFAQLVIPDGQYVSFSGKWTANGLFNLPPFDYQIGMPEPATLSILAVGGLALIRRRRRT